MQMTLSTYVAAWPSSRRRRSFSARSRSSSVISLLLRVDGGGVWGGGEGLAHAGLQCLVLLERLPCRRKLLAQQVRHLMRDLPGFGLRVLARADGAEVQPRTERA